MMNDTPSLDAIHGLLFGASKALTLKLALELDIFTAVARRQTTANGIARTVRSGPVGVRSLLDALCGMGFLLKRDDAYCLTETAAAFLVRDSASYYGDSYLDALLRPAWPENGPAIEAIRAGNGMTKELADPAAAPLWESWSAAHAVVWREAAAAASAMWEKTVDAIDVPLRARILDLACGLGIRSFAWLQRDPEAVVTIVDRHRGVLESALEISRRMGVSDRVEPVIGDIRTFDARCETQDIVYIGGVLYIFSKDEILDVARRSFGVLENGGYLIIDTMVADEGRCLHERALIQSFRRMLYNGGAVPTYSEYGSLLEQAGFSAIDRLAETLIVVRK